MRAEAKSFSFLGNEGLVRIPFFQRGYVWDDTNWEDLLGELTAREKPPFLGSLILKQQEREIGHPNEVLVIDGQQRLTTLSVLLKALFDLLPETIQQDCERYYFPCLFYKIRPTDRQHQVKIQHSRVDSQYFQMVLEAGVDKNFMHSINADSNRILQCYKFFFDKFANSSLDDNTYLFNRIVDHDNKMLVLIDLSDGENEQAIFDTINSSGVRLSCADVIKNAIYQRAITMFGKEEAVSLYSDNWESIFSGDDDAIRFWEAERATGRLMRNNIEILLHSVAVIKGIYDPDIHILSDLSSVYKKAISLFDGGKLKHFITEIAEYAKLYREKIPAFDRSTLLSYADDALRLFHILSESEVSTFHPFILYLHHKYQSDVDVLNKFLRKIECFVLRRMIAKKETKSYNKYCKAFISNENSIEDRTAETSDIDVLEGLKNISNKNASLLLFWIELYRRALDNMQSVRELKYNYSLEHVLPQKWEEHWANVPIVDDSGQVIMIIDEAKKVRTSKCYWIGNMTLLNSALNSSLRNYSFSRKIEGEGRKKGIRDYDELSITKDIIRTYDRLQGNYVWNETEIIRRTGEFNNAILAMWPA